ncbi:MAG: alanine--tRNA ligase [Chloroflexi bacterium]|nr:alanine--tRNA ligase [Chloroflexota bacterium]|tara:strand:- start:7509 stop:10130 length:2622 start_codon:yes stop_codon:yes gene_type:complete
MKTADIRDLYLGFFEARQHAILPSSSLVPVGDPSVLLTSAGMQQFKPYFSGEKNPPYSRITTVQKCFRATDIDEVGDLSHLTCFEMLGNFSFGDYFKEEAIKWARQLVLDEAGIDPSRLWVTVYEGGGPVPRDDEAVEIWTDLGHPGERIAYAGEDNFWGPTGNSGPCGPTTELHINLRPDLPDVGPMQAPDQYLEIWNVVFNQYFKSIEGELNPLDQQGVDTGAGLERWAVVLQGVSSIYETDTWKPLIEAASECAGVAYDPIAESGRSLRVIAQHSRASAFLIGDGVMPGNEGRGYVLRRSIRQAVRHGRQLNIDEDALGPVVASAIKVMAEQGYGELLSRADFIQGVVQDEEGRFRRTLDSGITRLEDILAEVEPGGKVDGARAFELYDTFGFPMDITRDIAGERGFGVDEEAFTKALASQKARSRSAHSKDSTESLPSGFGETIFTGYDFVTSGESTVVAIENEGLLVQSANAGSKIMAILDQTPFYGESGGQVGDTGVLEAPEGLVTVLDTVKSPEGTVVHICRISKGVLAIGDRVRAVVDRERRFNIMRNHTATHLLHAALRRRLGDHVRQAGSLVDPDRLRFDFTHPDSLTDAELEEVQAWVNAEVLKDHPVETRLTEVRVAVEAGAMALFGEKYGEVVRMVTLDPISTELCGGTHCSASNQIGLFAIVQQTGIAAGVRRIEAVTGDGSVKFVGRNQDLLKQVSGRLEAGQSEVLARVEGLLEQLGEMRRRLHVADLTEAARLAEQLSQDVHHLHGVQLVCAEVSFGDRNVMRHLTKELQQRLSDPWVILLGSISNGKPSFVAAVSPAAVDLGLHAGELAKYVAGVAGGSGGGRPELAMSGGKHCEKLPDALDAGRAYVEQLEGSV